MGKLVHQSVSGILRYNQQSFLVQRSYLQRYFPGYWCFPGGKVSKIDSEGHDGEDVYRRALIREFQEELGIDITDSHLRFLDTTLTPDFAPYRFENHFFVIELNQRPEIKLDGEHRDGFWIRDDEIDSFFSKNDVLTIPPILFFLNKLAKDDRASVYKSEYLDSKQELVVARYLHSIISYMVPSQALPPSRHTNVLLIGNSEHLLVDPSPRNEEHVEILVGEFKKYNVKSILISHWHPDHHQFVSAFASKLNVPILLTSTSLSQINNRWGDDYFNQCEVNIIQPEDEIVLDDIKLKVKSHDGHALGQVGLETEDQSWVFVSDVFQGVGSVVVEDMEAYIPTLESLLKYPEDTIYIPSHGFPIQGHNQLSLLLKHRLDREKQVAKRLHQGKTSAEILSEIYPDLAEGMKRYALKNIEGHIKRIQNMDTLNS